MCAYFSGKDRIIFMTKDDYEQPPKVFIPDEDDDPDYEEPGILKVEDTVKVSAAIVRSVCNNTHYCIPEQ